MKKSLAAMMRCCRLCCTMSQHVRAAEKKQIVWTFQRSQSLLAGTESHAKQPVSTPPSPAAQRYYLRKQERYAAPAVLGWARQACSVSAAPTCKGAGAGAGPDMARS